MFRASKIAERLTAVAEHVTQSGGTDQEAITAMDQHAKRLGYTRDELAEARDVLTGNTKKQG